MNIKVENFLKFKLKIIFEQFELCFLKKYINLTRVFSLLNVLYI